MMNARILIGIICFATAMPTSAKTKAILKLLDATLGQTEDQMREGWGGPIQDIPTGERTWMRGRKMLMTATNDSGFMYVPDQPGYATSTTTGRVDRRGNISATTTTTETPPAQGGGFYMHWRTVFYFDAERKVYRWEIEQCSSLAPKLHDQTTHTPWEIVGVRELRPDKKGQMKAFTVQKPSVLGWR
jgi:hypothetical protein